MANTRTASRRNRWLPEHVAQLRRMAATRPVGRIAHALGRTESSVRSKAHQEGISFASPARAPGGRTGGRGSARRAGVDTRHAQGRRGAASTGRGGTTRGGARGGGRRGTRDAARR